MTPPPPVEVALLAPSPILTVTLERGAEEPELHLHAGGQGFWVARMLRGLGVEVGFCAPLGGETGTVLGTLLEEAGLVLDAVETRAPNGSYVHDRRGNEGLVTIAETSSPRLSRHEADALFAAMLSASLDCGVAALTGPRSPGLVSGDFYRRLARDLTRNGCIVAADLSGEALRAAVEGGLDLLHLSERELGTHVGGLPADTAGMVRAIERLRVNGARQVLVSRGPLPALALLDDGLFEVVGPVFEPLEHRGPGDSMFAAIVASLARGRPVAEALRLGAAAGALNATRRGLGSGTRQDVERLARSVELRPLKPA
ncbi:MAG: hypothetical protein JW895_10080 [Thermoleophilaceae bacterium]|nr:hypothetical protein [Thermoleophilaceae bacterium]